MFSLVPGCMYLRICSIQFHHVFLPLIQPYSGVPPDTEFFLKKNQDDSVALRTRDERGGGTGQKGSWEMGVEEAGEELPVGKVDIKCGLYFCGEFLMVYLLH